MSDALVGAALKERALQADRKKKERKERNEGEGKLLSKILNKRGWGQVV